jgi:hypothetical protein
MTPGRTIRRHPSSPRPRAPSGGAGRPTTTNGPSAACGRPYGPWWPRPPRSAPA